MYRLKFEDGPIAGRMEYDAETGQERRWAQLESGRLVIYRYQRVRVASDTSFYKLAGTYLYGEEDGNQE